MTEYGRSRLACTCALWVSGFISAATAATDTNWLANPGFETASDGAPAAWHLGMEGRGEGEAVWQEGGAHSGSRCLRVRLTTAGDYYMGQQRLSQPVVAGRLYQIDFWYRSDAATVAHPCVYNVAENGHVISAWEAPLPAAETWTRVREAWVPPPGTVRFELQLRAQTVPGTAWFDDVMVGTATELEAEREAGRERVKAMLAHGPLRLRALSPSERPKLTDLIDADRLARLQAATSASLFAARGEAESLGLAVLGLGSEPLRATVGDLVGPGDSRIAASTIAIRWAGPVRIGAGVVLDPLFEQQPFRAFEDCLPMLWLTIKVPRTASLVGTYRGTVTVRSGDRSAALPFSLRVHDFELPRTTYLQSSFWLFRHTIRNAYGLDAVPPELFRAFLDICLESRLAPIDSAEWHDQPLLKITRDGAGELQVDWDDWDTYLRYCFDRGMSTFNVADNHWFGSFFRSFEVRDMATGAIERVELDPARDAFAETVTRFFRLAHAHFQELGWADRGYLQAYDEPAAHDTELLEEIAAFHRAARRGWPGLRTLITAAPQSYPALNGSTGIWCPLTSHYDDAVAAERRQAGEEVWWYVCCAPRAPWANVFLDQSGAAHRVLLWQTFQHKADGLLYWGVNHWPRYADRTMEPLPKNQRWPTVPWDDGGRNGDGYFIYPHPDGPLTSLRLEIMRDGVEDYDALRLLQDLVDAKRDQLPAALLAQAEAALEVGPDISQSLTNYPKTADAMLQQRGRINELIVELSQRP